jgi:hypothetical protein
MSVSVVCGYVSAVWLMTSSMVIVAPGKSVDPQRNPGDSATSAPFTAMSASTIN